MRLRRPGAIARYFVVVMSEDDRLYDWLMLPAHPQGERTRTLKGPATFTVGGFAYDLDTSLALPMFGWDPGLRPHWWTDIAHILVRGEVAIMLYRQGNPKPLDRIKVDAGAMSVTPEIQRTLDREVLLRRHQARMPFGSGASSKVILIILVALVGLFLFMYMGGFHG